MFIQNQPSSARFSGALQKRVNLKFSGNDSDTLSLGQGSTSQLLPSARTPEKTGNLLQQLQKKLFKSEEDKNLKKQESAPKRMRKQIKKDIKALEKEHEKILSDIYLLAAEYSHRTNLQTMLIHGYRLIHWETFKRESHELPPNDLIHEPNALKDLNLPREKSNYFLSWNQHGKLWNKRNEIYKDGPYYRVATTTASILQPLRLDPVDGLNAQDRTVFNQNTAEKKKLEEEIEKIKAERLSPIDKKLEQYKQDLKAFEQAANIKPEHHCANAEGRHLLSANSSESDLSLL